MSFMMESNGTTIQYVFFIKIITEAQAQKGGRRPGWHHHLHVNHPSFTADIHNAEWHFSTAELEQPMVSKITCNASNTKVKTCSAASGRLFGRSLKGKSAHDWRLAFSRCHYRLRQGASIHLEHLPKASSDII
jgi:hypothetical protein